MTAAIAHALEVVASGAPRPSLADPEAGMLFRAACFSCGWRGEWRPRRVSAADDAAGHYLDVTR